METIIHKTYTDIQKMISIYCLNEVEVWQVTLDIFKEPDITLKAHLTPDELERSHRFVKLEDRVRFIGMRSALRILLGNLLDLLPKEVPIDYGQYGKPICKLCNNLYFNISHSGHLGLIAISKVAEVGIDIEQIRSIDDQDISRELFTEDEILSITSISGQERLNRFFRLWVKKEAMLKALGVGMQGVELLFNQHSMWYDDLTANLAPASMGLEYAAGIAFLKS